MIKTSSVSSCLPMQHPHYAATQLRLTSKFSRNLILEENF